MPTNEPRPSKNQRREEARVRAQQMRKEQESKARRNRFIGIGALGVAVIALVVAVVMVVNQSSTTAANASGFASAAYPVASGTPGLADVTAPKGATSTGGIPVSSAGVGVAASSGVTVDLYFDFLCPWCGKFDQTNADDIAALVKEPGVTVVYHPISIMDQYSSGTFYSTRAANAAAVIADQAPDQFPAFVTAMLAKSTQPEENSEGLTDAKIGDIASGVGVPSDVIAKFTTTTTVGGTTSRTFAPWIVAATALTPVGDKGYVSTPTVLIDGKRWSGDFTTAGTFKAAVEAAHQG
ncbi:MAG: thioredoxin domain-containing protein [Actinobacteria bacterium]|nr:thioredoxin domain-containing protein [Actinomycetota bacterium]MCG2802533.1 DsbA family protein [Cellulomonas sp.]